MRWLFFVLVLATACGRYGFEERESTGDPDASTPDTSTGCVSAKPSYTFVVGTSRYRRAGTDQWLNSENDCEEGPGMHLLTVDGPAELAALAPLTGSNAIWIGLTDRITEGTFLAVTGEQPPFTPWAAGAPTAGGGDCVSWDPMTNTFADDACNLSRDRICECDGRDPAAGAY